MTSDSDWRCIRDWPMTSDSYWRCIRDCPMTPVSDRRCIRDWPMIPDSDWLTAIGRRQLVVTDDIVDCIILPCVILYVFGFEQVHRPTDKINL